MISLKKLLTEDVNYILKKSPNAIIAKAADLMAGIFRIKFKATRDEETPPNFEQDVMYVLTSSKNTQYGPASKFANGDWYYVIGNDTKSSERRLITDVLLYPKIKVVNVDKGKQTSEDIDKLFLKQPKSSGTVGSSDVIKASDFINAIDPKAVRIPETLGTGETLINQLKEILNNTVADASSSDEKIVIVKKEDGEIKKDDTIKKDGEIKKDDTIKKDGENKKDEPIGDIVLSYTSIFDDPKNPGTKLEQKITKQELIAQIDNTSTNWVAEAFQQLIMQKVVPIEIKKDNGVFYLKDLPPIKIWTSLRKPIDGDWGDKSKDVIRELNKRFKFGENNTKITPQLLDKLLTPVKTESIFSLKSILQEIKLQEQDFSDFDLSDVKPRTPGNITAPVKKEVPKSTTTLPIKSTTPKVVVSPKKEPATKTKTAAPVNTTTAGQKWPEYPIIKDKPYRRNIDDVAYWFGKVPLQYDNKLKVWWFTTKIKIVRGPNAIDETASLHLRDDGTIQVMLTNSFWLIKGVNAGWNAGGQRLAAKNYIPQEVAKVYVSKVNSGPALFITLKQALQNINDYWSATTEIWATNNNGGWIGLT
jgi:hypothetical protein